MYHKCDSRNIFTTLIFFLLIYLNFLGVEAVEYVVTEFYPVQKLRSAAETQKDYSRLPEFPLKNPADLQVLELDCTFDKELVTQLVRTVFYFSCFVGHNSLHFVFVL